MHVGHVCYVNNVVSTWKILAHKFSSSLSQIEAEYRVYYMKRYLHHSSFSLCSRCVNATLVICDIMAKLSDIKIANINGGL